MLAPKFVQEPLRSRWWLAGHRVGLWHILGEALSGEHVHRGPGMRPCGPAGRHRRWLLLVLNDNAGGDEVLNFLVVKACFGKDLAGVLAKGG